MKIAAAVSLAILAAPLGHAADIEAGKAKVATVCAACHGATGVSVSNAIPNLAAQRAPYIESQLKALKDGSRKNPIMNAIAAQLSAADISNVAAYFASLPGAAAAAKSELLPNVARTHVALPGGFPGAFTRYHAMNFPDRRQVNYFYANAAALKAAREGKPLPDGSLLVMEVHAAKLDADKKPVTGADGLFVADKLLAYAAMGREAGWGGEIPEMLRNGDWNYAAFSPAGEPLAGANQAECLACHKPQADASYVFTLKRMAESK